MINFLNKSNYTSLIGTLAVLLVLIISFTCIANIAKSEAEVIQSRKSAQRERCLSDVVAKQGHNRINAGDYFQTCR